MEIVDNLILLVIPGTMEAGLGSLLFWGSLTFALAVAFVAAFPVNWYLISRGKGHPVASLNFSTLLPSTDGVQLAYMLCDCSVEFSDPEGGPCL